MDEYSDFIPNYDEEVVYESDLTKVPAQKPLLPEEKAVVEKLNKIAVPKIGLPSSNTEYCRRWRQKHSSEYREYMREYMRSRRLKG